MIKIMANLNLVIMYKELRFKRKLIAIYDFVNDQDQF